jgi:hypothetical protein
MRLLFDLGRRVKAGTRFSAGDTVADVIQDFAVKLVACADGLRLIVPDSKGELEREKMEPAYASQYNGLEEKRSELCPPVGGFLH